MVGKIYLIPTPISEDDDSLKNIPTHNMEILKGLEYFVVENVRTARRFISKCKLGMVIDTLTFIELSEHTAATAVDAMLQPILAGRDCGVMSEAGVPAVADPGALLVAAAHRHNIEVVPLVGPSSIIMSLMASGANGQSFAFNGYLPIKADEREKKILQMTALVSRQNQTQIFIEAPYRNVQLFEALIKSVPAQMKLTVASNITSSCEYIKSYSIERWRREKINDILQKIPVIYVLGN